MLLADQEEDSQLMKGKKTEEIIGTADDDSANEPITTIVDSTGLTTATKGAYIEDEWKKERRKYGKLTHSIIKKIK
jgi:hypothetical protein